MVCFRQRISYQVSPTGTLSCLCYLRLARYLQLVRRLRGFSWSGEETMQGGDRDASVLDGGLELF